MLCEFRARLVKGDVISLLLDRMIEVLKAQGVLKSRQTPRTDSTHILSAVRDLSRLELVGKTRLPVLNLQAVVHPAGLKPSVPGEWQERYVTRWEDDQLPKAKTKRIELGEQVDRAGMQLDRAVFSGNTPIWLREIPASETRRQVWVQNFYADEEGLHWRRAGNIPPAAQLICSPFDTQARYHTKRPTNWVGYQVHLTEVCDPDSPLLITNVITLPVLPFLGTYCLVYVTGQVKCHPWRGSEYQRVYLCGMTES